MTQKLSDKLRQHIKLFAEEINQNRIYHSILNCPLSCLEEYIEVLKRIDLAPNDQLLPYINIAERIAKLIEECYFYEVIVNGINNTTYVFEIPSNQVLPDFSRLQEQLIAACSKDSVSCCVSTTSYGTITLEVNIQSFR